MNRKRRGLRITIGLTMLLAWGGIAKADQPSGGDQGFGLMLGVPSGFTWKMFLSDTMAIDANAGVSHGAFDASADLVWHNFEFTKTMGGLESVLRQGQLPVYIGVGPRFLFEDKSEFGIRVPLGVSFLPNNSYWEFFAEVAPIFRLTPDAGINGHYAIGARYYFPAVRPHSGVVTK